jgi:flagellar hook protein FlgE
MNVFGIALSGMQAAQAQLNVTAQNIANLETPGYQSQRVDLADLSTGGVAIAGISNDPAAGPATPDGVAGSNVDLGSELINLTRAKLLYSANAAVVKVGQRMTGALLDMFDNQDHQNVDD